MSAERGCESLVLLIGSNPLPNLVTARLLEPKRVILLYTPQTEQVMERLKRALEGHSVGVVARWVNGTDPRTIRLALSEYLSDQTHLDYTGGTKVMAAHARMAFEESTDAARRASYLDERLGCLRFDDGRHLQATGLEISLETVLEVHGCRVQRVRTMVQDGPTSGDAARILTCVLGAPDVRDRLASELARLKWNAGGDHRDGVLRPHDFGLNLSVEQIPAAGCSKSALRAWKEFFDKNAWLEIFAADVMHEVAKVKPKHGLHCALPSGRGFEIDVGLVRGHRLFLTSCTTDDSLATCKLKLFEVAVRARQLGGDLARSALICFVDGGDTEGSRLYQLSRDVETYWDAPNPPQVFGAAHLREWVGLHGERDLSALERWFEL